MKIRFKLNDKVRVIAGKDKGKEGKIIQILPEDGMVVVDGVNKMYKHIRSPRRGEKGQRVEFSAPLHVSKVMMLDPKSNKPTRIGIKRDGKKIIRVAKKSGEAIDKK